MTADSCNYVSGNHRDLVLETFNEECSKIVRKTHELFSSKDRDAISRLVHQVWIKFAQHHQKSPSHVNNNVQQNCARYRTSVSSKLPQAKIQTDKVRITSDSAKDGHGKRKTGYLLNLKFHGLLFGLLKLIEIALIILALLILFYAILLFHKPTQSLISRNTQDFIYPFMRRMRLITLPLVRTFPFLTGSFL